MSIGSRELELYAESTHALYKQEMAIARNLAVKKKRGIYCSELGRKAFMHLANASAKSYAREIALKPSDWNKLFTPTDRKEFAATYEKWFCQEYRAGRFESILPAKYQKAATRKATKEAHAHVDERRNRSVGEFKKTERTKKKCAKKKPTKRVSGSDKRPLIGGKPWGHKTAPKKYREMGATRRSDYAYPDAFMYPLIFRRGGKLRPEVIRKHIIAAEARFNSDRKRYPTSVCSLISKNINKAKKRFKV